MTPEAIHKHLRRQPFQPFKIFLSDGAVHEVRHPEMVFVMRREVVIALPRPGEQFARDAVYCDPLHITRIEPINGRGGKASPKSKG
ncbi:MAG: hypothetical protein ACLQLG_02130 [Thermoguttaceae bacterium]